MTPRTYWDQEFYLWEQHPEREDLIRMVWSQDLEETMPFDGWDRRITVDIDWGPLVATC